jgi:hypothetical protein
LYNERIAMAFTMASSANRIKRCFERPDRTWYFSELTLWWEVVHILAPQTNRDMREMKERYIEKIMGGRAPETRYVVT